MLPPEKITQHCPSKEQHALLTNEQSLNQSRETALNSGWEMVDLHSNLQGPDHAAKSLLSLRIPPNAQGPPETRQKKSVTLSYWTLRQRKTRLEGQEGARGERASFTALSGVEVQGKRTIKSSRKGKSVSNFKQ